MSLEFGLTITLVGMISMFSALALIVIVCEILKRKFREKGSELAPTEPPHKLTLLKKEELSEEEEAAVTAAIMAYMSETSYAPRSMTTLRRGIEPGVWGMAGRMELMNMRIRGR